jgi:hypothetical protein
MDLVCSRAVRFYEAPFQMKANGAPWRSAISAGSAWTRGTSSTAGSSRSRGDLLTLHTGKKIEVPFELMQIFADNLNRADLVESLPAPHGVLAARGPSERGDLFLQFSALRGTSGSPPRFADADFLAGTSTSREQ